MKNAIMSHPTPESARLDAPASLSQPGAISDRSPRLLWSGRVLSGLFALFMLGASAAPKLLQLPIAETTMAELGWPAGHAFSIGVVELSCVVLYLIPRTSVLGAVLSMGLLGGAMATQIRAENPLFSHVLFPLYVGLFMWGGLRLRSPKLRALFPIVRNP